MPSIPYCESKAGKGVAWSNSLFENNAEFSYGMCLAVKHQRENVKMDIDALAKPTTQERAVELAGEDVGWNIPAGLPRQEQERLARTLTGAPNVAFP